MEIQTSESVVRQRVQVFFCFAKIDGSTHGHPVRLVIETRAERGAADVAGRGRPRKYTPRTLKRDVERYFASITRKVRITEPVPTGRYDDKGHMIFEQVPVKNSLEEEVWVTEYIVPPEIAALCEFLEIDRSTWANYRDPDKNPEFSEITQQVYERMKAWNERELLTRPGKDIKGIVFNLENNYGYRERHDLDFSSKGIEEYLQKLEEAGGGGSL